MTGIGWSVGLDIGSHQEGDLPIPCGALVQGSSAQDRLCDEVRQAPRLPDVVVPTGGTFAAFLVEGRLVTQRIAAAVRNMLQETAELEWSRRPVQGRAASIKGLLFTRCLDLRAYTQYRVPSRLY